ncbi:MAG: hypothetical protein LC777_13330, partial [Actinobacteria bacterium]|nr:hypothetical protein [Actinomycetota bacterium]
SRIRPLGGMTISAAEPDPRARELASDRAAASEPVAGGGVLVSLVVAERDDRPALPDAAAGSPAAGGARSSAAAVPVRRLRLAAPVQLELVSGREGPRPEVVWASLPERSREAVLVLLARLISSGALEQPEIERDGAR